MAVYFVQAGKNGLVKIGHTKNVYGRIRSLQTSVPHRLKVLHCFEGSHLDERSIQGILKKHRKTGEWFLPASEVLNPSVDLVPILIDHTRYEKKPVVTARKNPQIARKKSNTKDKIKSKLKERNPRVQTIKNAFTLKEHIAKRGWNKSEFARQAGVQPCTAARWVNGSQSMDATKARELNAKFNIPLAALCPKIWGKA